MTNSFLFTDKKPLECTEFILATLMFLVQCRSSKYNSDFIWNSTENVLSFNNTT